MLNNEGCIYFFLIKFISVIEKNVLFFRFSSKKFIIYSLIHLLIDELI